MTLGDRQSDDRQAPRTIHTRAELARQLTALRVRAGLTVRELARRLGVPTATVGDYCSGRHLPGPAQLELFRSILRECGVSEGELRDWVDVLTRVRLSSDARVGHHGTPYRGLEPFRAEDAELFFGREAAIEDLLARIQELRAQGVANGEATPAMILVIGSSGSGKSSLLRAGVEARLRSDHGANGNGRSPLALMTPGEDPAGNLRSALAGIGVPPGLLIVDQLEELFGVAEPQRRAFLTELTRLRAPQTVVLAALRADFYDAALHEPALLPLLRQGPYVLGPMTTDEVRRAIKEPAKRAGATVEDGLVELLLADLAPGSPTGFAYDAGALPLLSHALHATWERARRNQLTVADYHAVGGLRGAIRQSAEQLYAELRPHEREQARRLLLRLVRTRPGAPPTRQRVSISELDDPEGVLDRFIAARLLTASTEGVTITHEALLAAWPRLALWLERDQAGIVLHHQLTDAANAWEAAGHDPSLLLRGARLEAIRGWATTADNESDLNALERRFLDASRAAVAAERHAARRRARRTRQLLAVVAALAVTAIVLAVVAMHARQVAYTARNQALSRQVAIEAQTLSSTDPALATQLAVAAYRIAPTTQATSTLLDASAGERPTRVLGPIGPSTLAVDGSGRILAVAYANSNQVRLYRLTSGVPQRLATVTAGSAPASTFAVAVNARGSLLAAGGSNHQVRVWSLANVAHPHLLAVLRAGAGTVYGLSFSPTGSALAAANSDGSIARWSFAMPSRPEPQATLEAPQHPALQAVAYSPNGRTLAAAGTNGELVLWATHGSSAPLASVSAGATTLTTVAYSPNGRTLAAGAQDALVYLWHLSTGGQIQAGHAPLHGFSSWVDSLAFSHNGRYLAAGDSDETLRVWSTSSWHQIGPPLPHPAPVTGAAFSADDRQLITVDENGTTRLWQFPPPSTYTAPGGIYTTDFTANARELAVISGGPRGDAELWNVADPQRPRRIASVHMPAAFGPVAAVGALSSNGRLLAVGNAAAKVQLVSLSNSGRARLLGHELKGAVPYIEQINFSPNLRLLSVGDDAGRIHMWDITNPAHPVALPTIDKKGTSSNVFGIAYSPNARLMAVACADGEVWLWDIANPRAPRLLARLKGFASYAYTVAFSPNGQVLAAGSADDTVRLWDLRRPSAPRLLARLTGPTSTVYQVAISPQGSTLAASTTGGQVWLWSIDNPAKPKVIATLTAATGEVFDVNFSPDGRTLVAGGTDDTLTFWGFHPAQVAAQICSLAGSPITRAEWSQYVQGAAYQPPCR